MFGFMFLLLGVAFAYVLVGLGRTAMHYPDAWSDGEAITTGFNPQFSWAFDQLVSLYYVWPFNSSDIVQIINATQHDPQQSLFDQAAMAGGRLVGRVEEEGVIVGWCGSPGYWTC